MFQGLFVDGFAGGGGASTGIAAAIGRDVDIAINHDPMAIAVHRANHPRTQHHCEDIRAVWPRAATRNQRVAGAWFSPDCQEHSKAKGGPVKDRHIRSLPMEIINWLRDTRPDVAYVENVEEMQQWGPLEQGPDGQWRVILHRKGETFRKWIGMIRRLGYRVDHRELRACNYGAPTSRKRLYIVMRCDGKPIIWPKATHGPANDAKVIAGELLPYRTAAECIDWSIPCPSIFLTKQEVRDQKLRIKRPLEEATLRRVAHGTMRYVVEAARLAAEGKGPGAFIVPVTHDKREARVHPGHDPLRTITTANGGEFMAADVELAPHITKFHGTGVGSPAGDPMPTVTANGEPARPAGATPLGMVGATLVGVGGRRAQSPPMPVDGPSPTGTTKADAAIATAMLVETAHGAQDATGKKRGRGHREIRETMPVATTSNNTALVSALMTRFHSSNTNGGGNTPRDPLGAQTAGGQHHGIVCAHMEQANTGMVGHTMRKPTSTIVGKGSTQRLVETTLLPEDALPPEMMKRANMVAAFLIKYYGEADHGQGAGEPFHTVTTLPRFAVVTVTIDSVTYVIVDIGLRMLTPRELARAQGFPDSYVLDPVTPQLVRGKIVHKPLTKAMQIRMIGNSVCPDVARALVAANQPGANDNWTGTVSEMALAA